MSETAKNCKLKTRDGEVYQLRKARVAPIDDGKARLTVDTNSLPTTGRIEGFESVSFRALGLSGRYGVDRGVLSRP